MAATKRAKLFLGLENIEGEKAAEWERRMTCEGVDRKRLARRNDAMAREQEGSRVGGRLLKRFGIEGIGRSLPRPSHVWATGIASLDGALEGGLSAGIVTELVFKGPSVGGQVALLHLIEAARRFRRFAVLVDGGDGFDPQSARSAVLEHLLWARCGSAKEALKVADVALRDENLSMAILDLRGREARELRRLRGSEWYRLQRLAGRGDGFFCVLTPQPMIAAAQTRVVFETPLSLASSEASLRELGAGLSFRVERLGKRQQDAFPHLIEREEAAG